MSGEKEKVELKVKRLKEIAKEKGALVIGQLFLKSFIHYPSLKTSSPESVPSLITDIRDIVTSTESPLLIIGTGNQRIRRIGFRLKEREYVFSFQESPYETPDGDTHVSGELALYMADKKVLQLSTYKSTGELARLSGDYGWSIMDVEGFIDGDWVQDFQELCLAIKELDERVKRESEARYEKQRIDELKGNFGIS